MCVCVCDREVFTIKEIEEDIVQFVNLTSNINRLAVNKLGVVSNDNETQPIEIDKISDDKQLLTILTIYLKKETTI